MPTSSSQPPMLRAATPDDALMIAELKVLTWRECYAGLMPEAMLTDLNALGEAPDWRNWLADTDSGLIALLLENQQGLIAYGLAGPMRIGDREGQEIQADGEIYALYVHPDHHRLGYGKRMMAGLVEQLLEAGFKSAGLWMVGGNDKAEHFYSAIGGEENGKRVEIAHGRIAFREKAWRWADLRQLRARLTLKPVEKA